jgi:hypothetical protein
MDIYLKFNTHLLANRYDIIFLVDMRNSELSSSKSKLRQTMENFRFEILLNQILEARTRDLGITFYEYY